MKSSKVRAKFSLFPSRTALPILLTGTVLLAGHASAEDLFLRNTGTATAPNGDTLNTSSLTNPLTGAAAGFLTALGTGTGVAPTAGNNYFLGGVSNGAFVGTAMRTPANANAYTFLGDSLTLQTGTLNGVTNAGRLLFKPTGTTTAAPQQITINNLILSGGYVDVATGGGTGGNAGVLNGNVTLTAGFTSSFGALAGEFFTVASTISGGGSLGFGGAINAGADTGTVTLTGANTYTGVTNIAGGILVVSNLANGGAASNIGASSASSANLLIGTGGTLRYTGADAVTDRGYTLTGSNSALIENANALTFGGQILTTGGNTTSFTKNGAGNLSFTNVNGTNQLSAGAGGNGLGFVVNNGTVTLGGTTTAPLAQTNTITGQLIIGTTNNATSPNVSMVINGGNTTVSDFIGVGRGNGTNGAIASLTLNNNAVLSSANFASGFANGVANYNSNAVITLNGTSTYIDSGVFSFGESANVGTSTFTVNDNAVVGVSGAFRVSRAGTAVFNQNGGTVTAAAPTGIQFADTAATGAGTYNLNGGTLNTALLNKGLGAGTVNFNGGTLVATASDNPAAATTPTIFITGVTANVGNAGAIINTNGFNVSASSPLTPAAGSVGGLTKNGAGILKLTATNTYTGATTINGGTLNVDNGSTGPNTAGTINTTSGVVINAGGALLLSGSTTINARVNDVAAITLNGGTFALNNVAEGGGGSGGLANTGTVGAGSLTLQATSVIDLQGNSLLHLAASGGQLWATGATLAIYNYNGNAAGGNGLEQILFGTTDTVASLTTAQLAQVRFYSDNGVTALGSGARFAGLGNGEIVPLIPEPSTWAIAILGVALVGWTQRRRVFPMLAALR